MRGFVLRGLIALACVGTAVPAAAQRTPAPARPASAVEAVEGGAREGYLLATTLYAAPRDGAPTVEPVSREQRVRVVPVAGGNGWVAVYRVGENAPVGYAQDPFVSRFGPDGRPAPPSEDPSSSRPATPSAPQPAPQPARLPEVKLADTADGVWSAVAEWTTVRTTPSRRSEAIGTIAPDTPFRLVAFERGWGRVLLNGKHSVGYVPGDALRQVKEPPAKDPSVSAPAPAPTPAPAAPSPVPAAVAGPVTLDAPPLPIDPAAFKVYVTPSGKRYHLADCRHVKDKGMALALTEAAKRYTPCRVCHPPELEPAE